MNRIILLVFFSAMFFSVNAQESNQCDTIKPDYVVAMPGFDIKDCEFAEFHSMTFQFERTSGKIEELTVKGVYRRISYERPEDQSRKISGVQIKANYANAILKAKGLVLSYKQDFFKLNYQGKNVYLYLKYADDSNDFGYILEIIEESPMKQEVDINLSDILNSDGKIALYGILFDVDRSSLKPESESSIKMIASYLKNNPNEKIIVVGHTDNSGTYERNMVLSKERAASVKNYLVSNLGIDPARIRTEGVGQVCPVASNNSEIGKKLNRRVEIVRL